MALRFATLDVFTAAPFEGNPLAVVYDADDLDEARMLQIAREFNLSETVFVQKPDTPIHSAKVRIFTPSAELPFAGHPTVGTAVLLAMDRVGGTVTTETDLLIVLEEKIGLVRIAVALKPGRAGYAVFDVPKLPEYVGDTPDGDTVAEALGISRLDIGFENHKPSRFSAGVPFHCVPVTNLSVIERVTPNLTAWDAAFGGDFHKAAYVYCRQTVSQKHQFHARMFAPTMVKGEDPATGSAAAAFAGVVARFDSPRRGTQRLAIEQGYEMGRPSVIGLELDVADGALDAVRIGGEAVRIMNGMIEL